MLLNTQKSLQSLTYQQSSENISQNTKQIGASDSYSLTISKSNSEQSKTKEEIKNNEESQISFSILSDIDIKEDNKNENNNIKNSESYELNCILEKAKIKEIKEKLNNDSMCNYFLHSNSVTPMKSIISEAKGSITKMDEYSKNLNNLFNNLNIKENESFFHDELNFQIEPKKGMNDTIVNVNKNIENNDNNNLNNNPTSLLKKYLQKININNTLNNKDNNALIQPNNEKLQFINKNTDNKNIISDSLEINAYKINEESSYKNLAVQHQFNFVISKPTTNIPKENKNRVLNMTNINYNYNKNNDTKIIYPNTTKNYNKIKSILYNKNIQDESNKENIFIPKKEIKDYDISFLINKNHRNNNSSFIGKNNNIYNNIQNNKVRFNNSNMPYVFKQSKNDSSNSSLVNYNTIKDSSKDSDNKNKILANKNILEITDYIKPENNTVIHESNSNKVNDKKYKHFNHIHALTQKEFISETIKKTLTKDKESNKRLNTHCTSKTNSLTINNLQINLNDILNNCCSNRKNNNKNNSIISRLNINDYSSNIYGDQTVYNLSNHNKELILQNQINRNKVIQDFSFYKKSTPKNYINCFIKSQSIEEQLKDKNEDVNNNLNRNTMNSKPSSEKLKKLNGDIVYIDADN